MLANGIKLEFKDSGSGSFTAIPELKEVPEMGVDPEKVENTTLADKVKKYEFGIGDPGELEYKCAYRNDSATASYRVLRKHADDKKTLDWKQTYPDGTTVEFSGQPSIKLGGGGVNGVIEFTLKIALQSDFKFTDGIGG